MPDFYQPLFSEYEIVLIKVMENPTKSCKILNSTKVYFRNISVHHHRIQNQNGSIGNCKPLSLFDIPFHQTCSCSLYSTSSHFISRSSFYIQIVAHKIVTVFTSLPMVRASMIFIQYIHFEQKKNVSIDLIVRSIKKNENVESNENRSYKIKLLCECQRKNNNLQGLFLELVQLHSIRNSQLLWKMIL